MTHLQYTTSLCGRCFNTIPGTLYENDGKVYMNKRCPCGWGGAFLVEPEVEFFTHCRAPERKSLYNHLVVDVTNHCNLKCPECYYPVNNRAKDRTWGEILNEIACVSMDLILGGAEPTMRKDLPGLIELIRHNFPNRIVTMITNGIRFEDEQYVRLLRDIGLERDGVFEAAISLHTPAYNGTEAYDKKLRGMEFITTDLGLRIGEVMFTVHTAAEVASVVNVIKEWRSCVNRFRIRGPHDTWATSNSPGCLFASEIFKALKEAEPDTYIEPGWDNNPYHVMCNVGRALVRVISCPDETNVILPELLGFGPFYRAKTGELTNFIHALIINRGWDKGWVHGRQLQPPPTEA